MSAPALRPLRIGEILDASIKIYQSNWRTLIGLAAIVVVPFEVLSGLVLLSVVPNSNDLPNAFRALSHPGTMQSSDLAASNGASAITTLSSIIATLLVTAACVKAVSDIYLDQPTSFRSSLRFAARRLPSLLWLELLLLLGLLLGTIALVIPGIYLYFAWAVAVPALLIEGHRGRRALGRSRRLVKGHWWSTLTVVLVAFLLAAILGGIFEGILLGILFSTSDALIVGVILVSVAGTFSAILVQPFQAAVTTVLYYDLRVRKEGYDVDLLAEQLGLPADTLPGPDYLGPESQSAS